MKPHLSLLILIATVGTGCPSDNKPPPRNDDIADEEETEGASASCEAERAWIKRIQRELAECRDQAAK